MHGGIIRLFEIRSCHGYGGFFITIITLKRYDVTKYLRFEAVAVVDEGEVYGAGYDFNALFRLDIMTGDCKYIAMFPEERIEARRLYTSAIVVGERIYFIPTVADNIDIYNTVTGKFTIIPIRSVDKNKYSGYHIAQKFFTATLYKKYIYMLPATYPGIVRIDTTDNTLEYFDSWVEENIYSFRKSVAVDDNYLYIPSAINDIVLKFDMDSCVGQILHVGTENKGCWGICKVGEYFWMSPSGSGAIIKWNPSTGDTEEYSDYPKDFNRENYGFTKIYYKDNKIKLIPSYANMGIQLYCNEAVISKVEYSGISELEITRFMFELGKYVYLNICTKSDEEHIRLNMDNDECEKFAFVFSYNKEAYMQDLHDRLSCDKRVVRETKDISLDVYLKAISEKTC